VCVCVCVCLCVCVCARVCACQNGMLPLLMATETKNNLVCLELLQHFAEQQLHHQRKVTTSLHDTVGLLCDWAIAQH